jgi:hypothetical protein
LSIGLAEIGTLPESINTTWEVEGSDVCQVTTAVPGALAVACTFEIEGVAAASNEGVNEGVNTAAVNAIHLMSAHGIERGLRVVGAMLVKRWR